MMLLLPEEFAFKKLMLDLVPESPRGIDVYKAVARGWSSSNNI